MKPSISPVNMATNYSKTISNLLRGLSATISGLPWMDIIAEIWKLTRMRWRGMANEGVYEVLEYESRLELLDKKGRRAKFTKKEKVRYLQNNIIAYQDHVWGDGKILIDYRCSPGIVVDRYRPGNKTFLLISLRESKNRGDKDVFNIEWGIRDGFLRSQELWETEILHKTRSIKVRIIFPKSRPPQRVWIKEHIRRKKQLLDRDSMLKLPNGRWQMTWQSRNPRLNERYQFHWVW